MTNLSGRSADAAGLSASVEPVSPVSTPDGASIPIALERLRETLDKIDEADAGCPIRHARRFCATCPKCHATTSDPCGPLVSAEYHAVVAARVLVTAMTSEDETQSDQGPMPWEAEQPIAKHARTFRGRLWVPLELAESTLQWWQKRDWEHGWAIARLEQAASGIAARSDTTGTGVAEGRTPHD